MKSKSVAIGIAFLLGAACAEEEGTFAPGPTPSAGQWRDVPVFTGAAVDILRARVDEEGRLVYQGDIVLGHVDELHVGARAGYIKDSGKRWSKGTVHWWPGAFNGNATVLARIEEAMDHIEQRTPVRFVKMQGGEDIQDYLDFRRLPDNDAAGGKSDVGQQGGRQELHLRIDASRGTIIHELLHALGQWHEQSRPDRDDHVSIDGDCVMDDYGHNYGKESATIKAGPYDFGSIMHYDSVAFCEKNASGACKCLPMVRKAGAAGCASSICSDGDGDGFAETIDAQRGGLSFNDAVGLNALYGKPLGSDEGNDEFATVLAVGDFDGDGWDDLAVGAPYETHGAADTTHREGAVYVYRGSRHGLLPWKSLNAGTRPWTQSSGLGSAVGSTKHDAHFGTALAVGDFDDNGVDDLAISAPGEPVGEVGDAGAIYVFLGFKYDIPDGRHGLQPWKRLTRASLGAGTAVGGDEIGAALAAGDFDGDGDDDLAIGAPHLHAQPAGGGVIIGKASSSGFAAWTVLGQHIFTSPAAGDAFGFSLAADDFDADGKDDLAVGAPYKPIVNQSRAGHVSLFRGGAFPTIWFGVSAGNQDRDHGVNHYFGYSLAAGKLDNGPADLAIGVPRDGSGRVHLYRGVTGDKPAAWRTVTQSGLSSSNGVELFGHALAIGRVDGDTRGELVVGAPSDGPNGRVFLFRGEASDVEAWTSFTQGSETSEYDADLGRAVAVGDFDKVLGHSDPSKRRAAVVGADDDIGNSTGHVYRYDFQPETGKLVQDQTIVQATIGPFYSP